MPRRHERPHLLPLLVVLLGVGVALILGVNAGGPVSTGTGLLRVDAVSAWMLAVVGTVAVVVALAAWACAPKAAHRQTDVMEKAGTITVSAAELRAAVNALADSLAGSGDVFASDDDPELVRDATPFALKTTEALLTQAGFTVDAPQGVLPQPFHTLRLVNAAAAR